MPEAPEVQTVVSTLEQQIQGRKVIDVEIRYPRLLENLDENVWKERLVNQTLLGFSRIGKYLILTTEKYAWIIHLRMEGKFYIVEALPENMKHVHAVFELNDGRKLLYHDTRKFGRMALYDKQENVHSYPCLKNVGLDVLDDRVDGKYVYNAIHSSSRNLKSILLDQSIMAGIGNIYCDEICFLCKLDPRSKASRLSKKDCENIVYHSKNVIRDAMKLGGTTIRSYTSSLGVTGLFQLNLRVHTKKGEPCPVCQNTIVKRVVSQRGTYICLHCQKRK